MHFYIHPVVNLSNRDIEKLAQRLEPHLRGLSVREINLRVRIGDEKSFAPPQNAEIVLRKAGRFRLEIERIYAPIPELLPEMTSYDMRVVRAKKLKSLYPYEMIQMLEGSDSEMKNASIHSAIGRGQFIEYDLNENNLLVPVQRPYGGNSCSVVCGLISNQTAK